MVREVYADTTIDYHSEQCEIKCNLTTGTCTIKIGNKIYNKLITAVERKGEGEYFSDYYLHFEGETNQRLMINMFGSDIGIILDVGYILTTDDDYNHEFFYDKQTLINTIREILGDELLDFDTFGLLVVNNYSESGINYKKISQQSQSQNSNRNNNQANNSNNATNIKPAKENGIPFKFTCSEGSSSIYIDGIYVGSTPLTKYVEPGTHTIKAEHRKKSRYKPFEKQMLLTDNNTDIHIRLKQLLNRKFEFYIEGNYCSMALPSAGATIGGYLGNFNMEASYYLPFDKSEDIYWCDDINMPYKTIYTPDIAASAKIGWGIPVGTRLRITPQAGANFCSLKEDNDGNKEDKTFANQANVIDIIGSVRFSFAVVKHLGISITPEYLYMFKTSEGYEVLKDVSPKIQDWSDGFNLKLGLVLFF